MRVEVDCSRLVDREGRPPEETVTLPDGATVGELLRTLGYDEPQLSFLVVVREGKRCQKFTRLADGDRLEVAVPLGGG